MSFRSALFAASALIAATNAHITITSPVGFSADVLKTDKGAITAEQFPCKNQLGYTVTTLNAMKVGEAQKLEFDGSAVHGGGSCQLSYTTDTEPTKDSVFKVIKSIEGGCPGVDGPKSFEYTLPDSIPNGKGTFAWSWFAKMSGAPEFYMNCAPIDVTGGASDASGLDALPDMFVANIASTTCKSPLNKAVKFPNPGENLEDGGTGDLDAPTGECGATGSTPTTPQEPASSAAPVASQAPVSSAVPVASQAPVSSPPTAPTAPPAASASATGGVFAPGASSAAPTTLATIATAAPAAPSVAPPTGGSNGGSCTQDGAIVCNGADQFGICNQGSIVWQAVAPGTTCSNGSVQKRSMYYGRHARRN